MARIRYVKPEFFSDTTIAEVSRDARLFYIGLFCVMDCNGVTEDNAKLLKRDIFPYDDDITRDVIEKLLEELVRAGRIVRLEHAGKKFLVCPRFGSHQKFHHRELPKYQIPLNFLLARGQPGAEPSSEGDSPPASRMGIGIGIGMGIRIETGTGTGNGTGTDEVPAEIKAANEKLLRLRRDLPASSLRKAGSS